MKALTATALKKLRAVAAPLGAASLPPPTLGKYRVIRELGHGAVGVVYEGEDTDLRRRVAIKVLGGGVDLSEVARRRFQREAQSAAGLSHPNVVTVHDAGEQNGKMYLVMELVEGKTLADLLAAGTVDLTALLTILEKAARGVGAAHEKGIVHRDLKPANVFITPSGEPKVGDFGLATVALSDESLTRTGTPVGTPLYMAPEQVQGESKSICPGTDVYALGAILYQVITGNPPHAGSNVAELYSKIMHSDPAIPRKLNGRIPVEVEAICLKALEKNPGRRYQTAGEFADDLRRYLDGKPVLARPSTVAYRAWKKVRRHPVAFVAVAVTVIAAIVLLVSTSRDRGRLTRQLEHQKEDKDLESLANRISGVYHDLVFRTLDAMRTLEDYRHADFQGPVPEEALKSVETITRGVEAKDPGLHIAQAWRGLALCHAGRTADGLAELNSATEFAGQDPFPWVLKARAHLASYATEIASPSMNIRGSNVILKPAEETEFVIDLRRRFTEAIRHALESRVWSRLQNQHGGSYLAYAEGASLLGEKKYAEAAVRLMELKDDLILRDEAGLLRGLAFHLQEQPEAAAEAWESITARRWPRVFLNAGMARLAAAGAELRRHHDPGPHIVKALAHFDEVIKLNPDDRAGYVYRSSTYMMRGKALLAAGGDPFPDFDRAIRDYDEILRLVPTGGSSYTGRGSLLGLKGAMMDQRGLDGVPTLVRAIEDLTRGLAGKPESNDFINRASAFQVLARILRRRGKDFRDFYDRAIGDYSEAISRAPENARMYLARGQAYLEKAEIDGSRSKDPLVGIDRAIEDLEESVKREPTADGLINLGAAHLRRGQHLAPQGKDPLPDYEEAIVRLSKAVELEPSDEAFFNRALGRLLKGEVQTKAGIDTGDAREKAAEDFGQSFRLNPKRWEAAERMALLYEVLGKIPEAIAGWEGVLKSKPDHPNARQKLDELKAR